MCRRETALVISVDLKGAGDSLQRHVYYVIIDGGTVVKVLRYKSEGRWFDSRRCHWNFSLT